MNAKSILLHSVFALLFIALPLQTQAALLVIDNFSENQSAMSFGVMVSDGPLSLTSVSTDLSSAERTLFSQANGDASAFQMVRIVDSYLDITNSPASAGSASVLWSFNLVNFVANYNAFLLDVMFIDHDVDIEIIVNNTSSSAIQNFDAAGKHYVNFSDFSDLTVFDNVTSLRLNLSGPVAWDGRFQLFGAQNPATVPEPDLFILLSFALIVFGFVKKNRS